MAPVVLSCEVTGCRRKIEAELELSAIKIYDQQLHVVTNKPEKPNCPELMMSGDAVEC